jgi:vacuolar protein sorting-associated protein 52
MDNATSEYAFVTSFFEPEPSPPTVRALIETPKTSLFSPLSPAIDLPDDAVSTPGSDQIKTPRASARPPPSASVNAGSLSKEDMNALNAIWKQIMDPALEHAQVSIIYRFVRHWLINKKEFCQNST